MAKRIARWKRAVCQAACAVMYNLNFAGFASGKIYRGPGKYVCAPGLNCYSCPGAIMSCPVGALQASLGRGSFPFYVVGFLLLFGVLFGRAVCGWLCPFGFIQELLYKIPSPKAKKSRLTRALSLTKYLVLAVFVVALPLLWWARTGVATPAFCKYICPAGAIEAGAPLTILNESLRPAIGALFFWKMGLAAAILAGCVFVYRLFCRFICPLGALYSAFNKVSLFGVRLDETKCDGCGACARVCKLDVRRVCDRECVKCGECASVCPRGAIDIGRGFKAKKAASKQTD